jgi:hypothetical protein
VLTLGLAFSLFLLSTTGGQYEICISSKGHIAIEVVCEADCNIDTECSGDKINRKMSSTTECSDCFDTMVMLDDYVNADRLCECRNCIISIPTSIQNDVINDHKSSNLFSYLKSYNKFIYSHTKEVIHTNELLI